ncbi:MAG: hypothetical protein J1E33_03225 [Alistipes sp.]|nr:hypothetical protein [Alistipes sp.]
MKNFLTKIRQVVSPVFILLFIASFVLWYIAKLNYTYTADYVAKLSIDGENVDVPCVVEGVGSNLLNHKIRIGSRLRIPLSDLEVYEDADMNGVPVSKVKKESLRKVLSVHLSDIKIVSVEDDPVIKVIK